MRLGYFGIAVVMLVCCALFGACGEQAPPSEEKQVVLEPEEAYEEPLAEQETSWRGYDAPSRILCKLYASEEDIFLQYLDTEKFNSTNKEKQLSLLFQEAVMLAKDWHGLELLSKPGGSKSQRIDSLVRRFNTILSKDSENLDKDLKMEILKESLALNMNTGKASDATKTMYWLCDAIKTRLNYLHRVMMYRL